MGWSINAKAITIPEGNVKRIAVNGVTIWEKEVPSPYEFLEYVYFDGSGMLELPHVLTGADTARLKFRVYKVGNVFGWYSGSTSGTNQYSLYASSSAYVRYDGSLSRAWSLAVSATIHDAVFTPTGYSDRGSAVDVFTAKTFTCGGNTMLGGLPNSTSAKAQFTCYGFSIDGKCNLVPAKRKSDDAIGLYDTINDAFYTGSFIKETAPSSLMMGNPFSGDDEEH